MYLPIVAATGGEIVRTFHPFTVTHYATVAVCTALIIGVAWWGCWLRDHRGEAAEGKWRRGYGWFIVAVFIWETVWYLLPENFEAAECLPLQFCDIGMLVGGGALLWRVRWVRGLLYFWACIFTIQAFLTPTLKAGPGEIKFYLFWFAHSVIMGAAVYDAWAGKFRPEFRDAVRSFVITFIYVTPVGLLDLALGWNYCFVGAGTPDTPTLMDVLGTYPLRLVWEVLITALGFTLTWVPWGVVARRRQGQG